MQPFLFQKILRYNADIAAEAKLEAVVSFRRRRLGWTGCVWHNQNAKTLIDMFQIGQHCE